MCKFCADLTDIYLPDLTHEERVDLLVGATGFPFVTPDILEEQLQALCIGRRNRNPKEFMNWAFGRADEMIWAALTIAHMEEFGGCWRY